MWLLSCSAFAASDWTALPPLTAPADALLAAGRAAKPDEHGAHVLLDETSVHLLPDGRSRSELHRVLAVTTRAGADQWGTVAVGWSEWYEDRPTIQARVITPDGAVHPLDPAHVSDAVASDDVPSMFTDRHVVRAPLPALSPGSVVEQLVVVERHAPFFSAGGVTSVPMWAPWPVDRRRISVVADPGVSVTWVGPEGAPIREVRRKGGTSLSVDLDGTTFESVAVEPDEPEDEGRSELSVSTAKDWASVVDAYRALVDARLREADLSARAATARGEATARDEVAARLLAAVRELRYVGVEFGESAITPRSPEDAFRNGYGDCKDKAMSLAGLLRASGIDADVALIRVGPGPDVSPLPGLDDFDHMIVHVPGDPELWIDPTSDFTPLGQLPTGDQGRQALIVAEGTTGLTRTPVSPSSASTWHVDRLVELPRRGKGHLEETTTSTGWIGDGVRWLHATATDEQVEKYYADRAESDFAATLVPPVQADGGAPDRFVVRVAMDDAGTALLGQDDATVQFSGWEILSWLPDWLLEAPDPKHPREHALALTPFRSELSLRVPAPGDFVEDGLPEPFDERFGPVTWTQQVGRGDDGAATVDLVFDTGDGRLTAADAQALWTAIAKYANQPREHIGFADPAAIAFGEGKTAKGVALARDALAAHPDDPLEVDRLARALLQAGLVAAATELEAKAVTALPDDVQVGRNQAFVLLHDRFGRMGKPGFDRAAAVAAVDRVLALDPSDTVALQLLASAWEVGDDGRIGGVGSDLDLAIDALQRRRALGEHDLDLVLANHLARAERWDDLAALVEELTPDAHPARFRVLVAAMREGPDAALAVPAARSELQDQATGLGLASMAYVRHRRYADAAQVLEASLQRSGGDFTTVGPALDILKSARRHEEVARDPRDPVSVSRAFLVDLVTQVPAKVLRSYASKDLGALLDEVVAPTARALGSESGVAPTTAAGDDEQLPPDVVADLGLAGLSCHADGEAALGWRVTCQGAPRQAGFVAYLVEEKGAARLRATRDTPGEVAAEALSRFERGDTEGGHQWVGWLAELASGRAATSDPFDGSPVLHLLPSDEPLAALAATAESPDRARSAARQLAKARAHATPEQAVQLDRALMRAHLGAEEWSDLSALARRLHEEHPDALEPLQLGTLSALRSRRAADWLPVVKDAAAAAPDEPELLRAVGDLETAVGDAQAAAAAYRALAQGDRAEARDLNQAAWFAMLDPTTTADAVDWARRAAELLQYRDAGTLHTLAAVLVAADRPDEALRVMDKGLEVDATLDHGEPWTWLQGRLAEAWGLPEVARAIYATLPAPGPDDDFASVRRLAADRLAALGG